MNRASGVTAGEALRALRDRWRLLLLAAVVAAVGAYVYTKLPWVEPRWRSSVWLQATGRFDYGSQLALQQQLRALAEQVRQLSVMREVDRNLHLDLPPERMLANTRAEPVIDSTQIRIDVEDSDGARAEQMALETAEVYSARHNAVQQGKLREEQVILTVLDRPSAATLAWPQTRLIVPVAALLGLLAGSAVILALAYLDDTLKTSRDIDEHLGLPVIGVVPAAGGFPSRARRRPGARAEGPVPRTVPTAPASPAPTPAPSRR